MLAPNRRSNQRPFPNQRINVIRFTGTVVVAGSIEARCSMRLWTPPKLVARVNSFTLAATAMAAASPPFTCTDTIPPKLSICLRAMSCPGCWGKPGIKDSFNGRMPRQKPGNLQRITHMSLHSIGQRLQTAQGQPTFNGRWHSTCHFLQKFNTLPEGVVRFLATMTAA